MISKSEPEARASLFHSLTAQTFNRAQFDRYLDEYLRTRRTEALSVEAVDLGPRDPAYRGELAVAAAARDSASNPDLAAFAEIQRADYLKAKEIIKAMAATDRAVLGFWAGELVGMVDSVQITEERY